MKPLLALFLSLTAANAAALALLDAGKTDYQIVLQDDRSLFGEITFE